MTSIQTLDDAERRVLARWAIACAERVLPLFDGDAGAMADIRDAVARTRDYSAGHSTAAAEIGKRMIAVKAAGAATTAREQRQHGRWPRRPRSRTWVRTRSGRRPTR